MNHKPPILLVTFIVSTFVGSFLNVVALRILSGESFIRGRSACVSCGKTLSFLDMIPLVSWLVLGGKCRKCGEKISYIYPLGEILTGVYFTALVYKFGFTRDLLPHLILALGLIIATVTDLKEMIVPDKIIIASLVGIVAARIIIDGSGSLAYMASGLGMFLFMYLVFVLSKEKLGGADVKIYGPIGLGLGLIQAFETLVLGSMAALVVALARYLIKKDKTMLKEAIPFFPFISIGTILSYFISLYR